MRASELALAHQPVCSRAAGEAVRLAGPAAPLYAQLLPPGLMGARAPPEPCVYTDGGRVRAGTPYAMAGAAALFVG
eukprot:4009553-Alexandrium_andersonii.AAC.1